MSHYSLKAKHKERLINIGCGVVVIGILVAFWEITAGLGWEYARIFPTAFAISPGR